MKTIAQLLQLQNNPFYQFSPEEREVLNDFLSKKSGQNDQQKDNLKNSSKQTPAIAKNVVHPEKGVLPTDEQVAEAENLADQPPYNTTEAA